MQHARHVLLLQGTMPSSRTQQGPKTRSGGECAGRNTEVQQRFALATSIAHASRGVFRVFLACAGVKFRFRWVGRTWHYNGG